MSRIMSKTLEKIMDINIFKLAYLIGSFLYCLPLTNKLVVPLFKIFIIWGVIVFLFNYFFNKKYVIEKKDYLLFLFIFLSLIGIVINYKYNFILNLISLAYLFIQMILMVSYNRKSLDDKLKNIKVISFIIVILTFICSLLSLLIYLLNFKYSYADGYQQILFGMFEGRLWGIYGNPNSLGQFGIVSIVFSIILLIINSYKKFKHDKIIKGFLYTNIILTFICLVLSNSRSSVCGLIAFTLMFCIGIFSYNKGKALSLKDGLKNNVFKVIIKTLLTLVLVCGAFSVCKHSMVFCSHIFKNIDLDFVTVVENQAPIENNQEVVVTPPSEDRENIESVNRDYGDSDLSNGRFELWQAGLKVFSKNPLFGVGVKNVNQETKLYLSYMTLLKAPMLSENLHNIYLQVLVSHGILAFVVLAIYMLYVLIKKTIYILNLKIKTADDKMIYKIVLTDLSLIVSLLVVNLFDSNIIYFCSVFFTFVFWYTISDICELSSYNMKNNNGKKNVLFMIDSLEAGGAEKALVDLVNKIYKKYNIYVKTLYNEGYYIQKLDKKINYSYVIKKPNKIKKRLFYRFIKYMPAKLLYQFTVSGNYDVEIAFHELLSTKILSGSTSNAYKIAWLHTNVFGNKYPYQMYSGYVSFVKGYDSFDKIVCVSNNIKYKFDEITKLYHKTETIYNLVDRGNILELSSKKCDLVKDKNKFTIVTIGRLEKVKGYDKLCSVINKLKADKLNVELWILGVGSMQESLEKYIKKNNLEDSIKLVGFQKNPYNYLAQADLFVSTSEIEGFSLVVAEALSLGIPIVSTDTDGPREILDNDKFGMIVGHSEKEIYVAIKEVIENKKLFKELKTKSMQGKTRFDISKTIDSIDYLLDYNPTVKNSSIFCTVFTPSYNRAYILDKLYESLKRQTSTNFEWVIVDDGSIDDTESLVKKWQKRKNKFNINYIKVENGGKQRAINVGLDHAKGKMFFIVDSDDYITDDAISKLEKYERTIKNPASFAGVAGLRGYSLDKVIGKANKNEYVDCTNLERIKYNLDGDKAEAYYTDILRKFKFPEIPNEKFVTERFIWDMLANAGYKIRWFNKIISITEYLNDGLTAKGNSLYLKNIDGYLIYIRNQIIYDPFDLKAKIGNYYKYYEIVKEKDSKKVIANKLLTSELFLNIVIILNKTKKLITRR